MVDNRLDSPEEEPVPSDAEGASGGPLSDSPSEDLPGELLADHLRDSEPYEVTADESEAEELDDPESDDDDSVSDPVQLSEAESVAQIARSSRPQRKTTPSKGRPTPRSKKKVVVQRGDKRATPAQFARESVEELKKVVWPPWPQVRQYFVVVLVFVTAIILYVSVIDTVVGALLLKLFG